MINEGSRVNSRLLTKRSSSMTIRINSLDHHEDNLGAAYGSAKLQQYILCSQQPNRFSVFA